MKKIKIKYLKGPQKGNEFEKSKFVGELLIKKGLAEEVKEEKKQTKTKELKTKFETKQKK